MRTDAGRWVVTKATSGAPVYVMAETPFPHMTEEQFLRELAEVEDKDLRSLVTFLWKDLERARADIDNITDLEVTLRGAMITEVRCRDAMIQKVIDLHTSDSTAPEICCECLDLLPCPTLRALEES